MKNFRIPLFVVICFLTILLLKTGIVSADLAFSVTDLGTDRYLFAINNKGEAVGVKFVPNDHVLFKYKNDVITDLAPIGYNGKPYDVNDFGQIVGGIDLGVGGSRAFLYADKKGIHILDAFVDTDSVATAMNNRGEIVVNDYTIDYFSKAFIWKKGSTTPLDMLGLKTTAWGINNYGHVVGFSTAGGSGSFLYKKGIMEHIGSFPPPLFNIAYDINDSDQIVGIYDNGSAYVSYIWEDGVAQDLPSLVERDTRAYAINNFGQIVGKGTVAEGVTGGILWKDGLPNNLSELIPLDSGWTIMEALDINDWGQIVGRGIYDGLEHAVLLTPISEIDVILYFFDESVGEGMLEGAGKQADFRLQKMRWMLVTAGEFLKNDQINTVCSVLNLCYKCSDEYPSPPDYVQGDATEDLAEKLYNLAESLECQWVDDGS